MPIPKLQNSQVLNRKTIETSLVIFERDANGLIRFNLDSMTSYAKSATARPEDWLNWFKNGKSQRFNSCDSENEPIKKKKKKKEEQYSLTL